MVGPVLKSYGLLRAKRRALQINGKNQPTYSTPIARLNSLLHGLQKILPLFTNLYGTKASILIIDEANELCALLNDPDGKNALHNSY